jgi:hypothetical protein
VNQFRLTENGVGGGGSRVTLWFQSLFAKGAFLKVAFCISFSFSSVTIQPEMQQQKGYFERKKTLGLL